jgi:hypothetical protein
LLLDNIWLSQDTPLRMTLARLRLRQYTPFILMEMYM